MEYRKDIAEEMLLYQTMCTKTELQDILVSFSRVPSCTFSSPEAFPLIPPHSIKRRLKQALEILEGYIRISGGLIKVLMETMMLGALA